MIVSIWRVSGAEKYRYRCRGGNTKRNVGMRTLEAIVRIAVCCLAARVDKQLTMSQLRQRRDSDGGFSGIDPPPALTSRAYQPRWS
ncbi:hypothetical protein K439DRAFT_1203892 [Ramaria rubella]|nr:hypothetical protein K439DRAFT_1203892 [Ramaria rubella]